MPRLKITTSSRDHSRKGVGLAISYGFTKSPFGLAILLFTAQGVCGLGFGEKETPLLADMKKRRPKADYARDDAGAAKLARRIFAGKPDVPLVLIGSEWQIAVWKELLKIRLGKTASYGALAESLSAPKAARAVGAAVGKNPVSLLVPCHRVVGAKGALTGYHWGIERKRAMLRAEGIEI
jgi:AraC family transcriptional regulator, regulatory protein of adaptative response / methylated-DNA-[protein]-cysteine methyltransferase